VGPAKYGADRRRFACRWWRRRLGNCRRGLWDGTPVRLLADREMATVGG
jgi:hypothetical protein